MLEEAVDLGTFSPPTEEGGVLILPLMLPTQDHVAKQPVARERWQQPTAGRPGRRAVWNWPLIARHALGGPPPPPLPDTLS